MSIITLSEIRGDQVTAGRKIIALDPAAVTGYCWTAGTRRISGVWTLTKGDARCLSLANKIDIFIAAYGCDLLAYEESTYGSHNPHVQAMHNELRGVIKLCAAKHRIEAKGFGIGTIKAFATGAGNAKKDQMQRAAKTMLGLDIEDDNECDAIWIAELARQPRAWVVPVKEKKKRVKASKKAAPKFHW